MAKAIWITLIIIIVLIVGGFLGYLYFDEENKYFKLHEKGEQSKIESVEKIAEDILFWKEKSKEEWGCCNNVGGCIGDDDCYKKIGFDNFDYSACDKISDSEKRWFCYREIILENEDFTTCRNLQNSSWRDKCITDLGTLKGDISLCEEAEDVFYREHCYWVIATDKKDNSICDKIKERIDIIDFCYEEVERRS